MKKLLKSLVLLLVITFMVNAVNPFIADAKGSKSSEKSERAEKAPKEKADKGESREVKAPKEKEIKEVKAQTLEAVEEEDKVEGENKDRAWKIAKDKMIAEKNLILSNKDELEGQKESLEEQYEAAKEAGDMELAMALSIQIKNIKSDMELLKQEMKQVMDQMKNIVRNKYTEEELLELGLISKELEDLGDDIEVLPVENIITDGIDIKLDTPVIVKQDQVMVSTGTISQLGATVEENLEENKTTITKGDTVITIVNGNELYVNGTKYESEVSLETVDGNVYLPLNLIAPELGLEVNLDSENKTLEIKVVPAEETTGGTTEETTTVDQDETTEQSTTVEQNETIEETTTAEQNDTTQQSTYVEQQVNIN
jgi:hypothetical protein